MPGVLQSAAGGAWAEQPLGARLDYTLQWSLDGDAIASSSWSVTPATSPPLVINGEVFSPSLTSAFVSGGVAGGWYAVTNTITTVAGRQDKQGFMVLIGGALPAASKSAIFPFAPAAVAALRRSRIVALTASHLAGITLSDEDLWQKLMDAEGEAERHLRIWLSPREVLPAHDSYDDDADALATAGERVEREPGYDYSPRLFNPDGFGMLELRAAPVIRIHWARFAYPDQGSTLLDIPRDWFRPEGRTNRVSIVPTNIGYMGQMNSVVLGALAAGRNIPFMLQVGYRAGLEDVRTTLPDLPALIQRMASVAVVEDLLLPQSGSISADGLSQSISMDAAKHREEFEAKLDAMRDRLAGVRVTFA